MSTTELVTDHDIAMIWAPMRHEFHCNVLFCGFETECPEQALAHMRDEHQSELELMEADLLALQSGLRPMLWPRVPVVLYKRPRGWWRI